MTLETLLVDQDGAVRWVTLNRPDQLNALSSTMLDELVQVIDEAEVDEATRVLVIRGAGRAFSAGYDVSSPTTAVPAENRRSIQADLGRLLRVNRQLERVWSCRIPVIAQVHGICIAGGTDLALHCDMVIAAANARIGYPPARHLGVPPTQMWLYNMGPQWSKRLLMGGDTMSGQRAAELGMAMEAVPEDELTDRVSRHAHQMARSGRDFLIGTKMVVNQGLEMMGRSTLQTFAASHDAIGHTSPDAKAVTRRVVGEGFVNVMRELNAPFEDDLI